MESISLTPQQRKDLILRMKRETKPSRRLRMHIVLLASDGRSPTEIARVLYCSRTTIYAISSRFLREGRAAFDDRQARGPRPLLGGAVMERVERLLEEGSPVEHGWLRSRWSCKLVALQLLRERLAEVSRETVRRTLHRLSFRWRRPRPVPPEKDSEEQIKEKQRRLEDVLQMTEQEAGSFFQDETKLETNPKVGFCWMRKGRQRTLPRLRGPTARCGLAEHSTFTRGVSIGSPGSAKTTNCSSDYSRSCAASIAATKSCTWQRTTTAATPARKLRSTWRIWAGAYVLIRFRHGLRRAIRLRWCGGRCTRRSAATISAPDWMVCWSLPRAIWRRDNPSG